MGASIGFDIVAHDHASRTFKGVGNQADRTSHKMRKMGAAVKLAGAATAAGIGLAAVAAYKLAKGAAEDQKAAAKLAVQLHNSAGATHKQVAATEEWITKQGKALGITDDELRPALGKLVTATHSVSKAQRLASLAMNVSAGTGKSLEQVSTALMKAQNGQVAGLAKLGVKTKDAKGKTLEFEQIQKNLAKTFHGQAAKAADTTAGRFERLKLVMSETGEAIGYKLLPVASQFAGWVLSTGLPMLGRFSDWFNMKVTPSLVRFSAFTKTNVIPVLREFGTWIQQKIIPVLADFYGTRIKQMISGLQSLRGSVKGNEPELRKFGAGVKRAAELSAKFLGPALKALSGVQIKGLVVSLRLAINALAMWTRWASFVISKTRAVGSAIGVMSNRVVAGGRSFARLAAAAGERIGILLGHVRNIPGRVKSAVGNLGSLLYNAGASVVQGLINGVQSKITALTDKLHAITSLIPKHKGPLRRDKALLTPAGVAIMEGLIHGIESKRKPLEVVLGKITEHVKKTGDRLKGLLAQRKDFAAGFQFGDSIFATPDTEMTTRDVAGNETTTMTAPTIASMKAFALQQKAQAAQVNKDVKRLVALGLSKSLIAQMQAQGAAGISQMHALAQGGKSDVAFFNATNKDTRSLYGGAGMAAGTAVYGGAIADAQKDARLAKAIAAALGAEMAHHTRKELEHLEFRLEGRVLVATLKKEKKDNGGKKLGLD